MSLKQSKKNILRRFFILFCQFCYWSSREVSIKEQSSEALLESINKQSMNLKESENKIYNFAWTFFKESNMAI